MDLEHCGYGCAAGIGCGHIEWLYHASRYSRIRHVANHRTTAGAICVSQDIGLRGHNGHLSANHNSGTGAIVVKVDDHRIAVGASVWKETYRHHKTNRRGTDRVNPASCAVN